MPRSREAATAIAATELGADGPHRLEFTATTPKEGIMRTPKLKLEEVEVESFEVGEGQDASGTVRANELVSQEGTCPGQTAACTACRPLYCN